VLDVCLNHLSHLAGSQKDRVVRACK
jgi:hypothetical protein